MPSRTQSQIAERLHRLERAHPPSSLAELLHQYELTDHGQGAFTYGLDLILEMLRELWSASGEEAVDQYFSRLGEQVRALRLEEERQMSIQEFRANGGQIDLEDLT